MTKNEVGSKKENKKYDKILWEQYWSRIALLILARLLQPFRMNLDYSLNLLKLIDKYIEDLFENILISEALPTIIRFVILLLQCFPLTQVDLERQKGRVLCLLVDVACVLLFSIWSVPASWKNKPQNLDKSTGCFQFNTNMLTIKAVQTKSYIWTFAPIPLLSQSWRN